MKKPIQKTLYVLILIFGIVIAIVIIKTFTYPFADINKPAGKTEPAKVSELSVRRFSDGLKFETISYDNFDNINFAPYDSLELFLKTAYPEIYKAIENYTIYTHSLVFRWKGKNSQLKPILFLSHYDVVPPGGSRNDDDNEYNAFTFNLEDKPAAPVTEVADKWEYGPFSGAVAKGRIYGRGALDMKNMMFAILEAADTLIKKGYVPERDIYIAFGHDEEIGGPNGATKIAEHFKLKGLQFDAVYDEGGIIAAKGSIEGIENSIALIGFAEKGFVSYRIKVKGMGGHSSMPPLQSAMGKAAQIMQRLEEEQMKQVLIVPIQNFLKNAGGSMSFSSRMAIANQWLFKSILLKSLSKVPATNALTRSTTALTMMKGSDANNILPPVAEFVVNFRILPGNSSDDILKHMQKACEGFDTEIEPVRPPQEPSNISPENVRGYEIIKTAIRQLYPEALISPYITIGGTDAIKYQALSSNIYRFSPMELNTEEQRSIHNFNEYISIENYGRMIRYFEIIMKDYDTK